MTSPTNVGSVSIDLAVEAKALAKQVRKQTTEAFKGLDLSAQVQQAVGKRPVTVRIDPDVDTQQVEEKVRQTRVPKVPVTLDPVLQAFHQVVRDQVRSISRQATRIPFSADTAELRAELSAELAQIRAQTKMRIPTEPDERTAYEAKLRAQLAAVAARVRQSVTVDVDVAGGRGGPGAAGSVIAGLANMFRPLLAALPIVGRVGSAVAGLISVVQRLGGQSAQMGGQVAGSFVQASGPIGSLVAAVAAASAAVLAFTTALSLSVPVLGAVAAAIVALSGAAAALPGALAGIGAGVGTLALGFAGISDAFKPAAGGGGGGAGQSAAQQARQVAAAARQVEAARRGITTANRQLAASERALAAAQRGVLAAQRTYAESVEGVAEAERRAASMQAVVAKARREAVEDIEDLNRALRGARLSEEEATLAVTDALRELNSARLTGNIPEIRRAELAYQRAQLSLEEATDTVGDLQAQTEDANAKGVEGSDKVQEALRDQADAYKGVRDAQQDVLDAQNGLVDAADGLKSAQDGVLAAQDGIKAAYDGLASAQDSLAQAQTKVAAGAGGVAQEVTKLAPAAQRFVDAVKALKPAFESLRLDVQERLFRGLDETVTRLGETWIPALRVTLGRYADTFNRFFRDLGTSVTTPRFVTDLQAAAESSRVAFARIGDAVTDSLVPAFGTLARAAGPFLEVLGDEIAKVVEEFSAWIEAADRTGGLTSFFDHAAQAMADIFVTGKEVGKLIGNIIRILINGNGRDDKSAVDSFNDGLRAVNRWLTDPQNQQRIADFVDDIKQMFNSFKEAYRDAKPFLDSIFGVQDGDGAERNASSLGAAIGSALVAGIIAGMATTMATQLRFLFDLILGDNGIVTRINRWLGINSPSTVMMETGRNMILGLVAGIGQMFGNLTARVRQIPGRVLAALGNPTAWLTGPGRNAVIGLGNGIVSMFANLRSRALGLRDTIINTGAGAGSWLVNAGRNVVFGLWNGIASLGGWLRDRVSAFVSAYVPAAIRNALGIASPSKVAAALGREVPAGLAVGILGGAGQVEAAAERIAALAVPDLGGSLYAADLDAHFSRSLQVADRKTVEAFWRSGSSGDPVLDGLRDMIGFRFRGDVQAALGS